MQPGAPTAYPPPGYYGGYGPYGPYYYPPPGYYYPQIQPMPAAPPPVPMRRNSDGMMFGGIALTAGGVVGFIVGTALLATANNRYEIYCDYGGYVSTCDQRDDEPRLAAGAVITAAGGVLLAVGIPLWIIGGKKVPATKGEAPNPTLTLGPRSAALRMAF